MRVRRQVPQGGATLFDQGADFRSFLRFEVVEQHHIAVTQAEPEATSYPGEQESLTGQIKKVARAIGVLPRRLTRF